MNRKLIKNTFRCGEEPCIASGMIYYPEEITKSTSEYTYAYQHPISMNWLSEEEAIEYMRLKYE